MTSCVFPTVHPGITGGFPYNYLVPLLLTELNSNYGMDEYYHQWILWGIITHALTSTVVYGGFAKPPLKLGISE